MSNQRSFTLIELLLSVSIIFFITTHFIPRSTFFRHYIVRTELTSLYTLFQYLQQRAIITKKPQKLIFNLIPASYSYQSTSGKPITHTLAANVSFGAPSYVKGPPGDPVTPITVPMTFPIENNYHTVTFFPHGKFSNGTIYLTDTIKKQVGALTCPISQVSYMRRYLYDGYKWKIW